jgi:hypothetical protein
MLFKPQLLAVLLSSALISVSVPTLAAENLRAAAPAVSAHQQEVRRDVDRERREEWREIKRHQRQFEKYCRKQMRHHKYPDKRCIQFQERQERQPPRRR